MNQLVQMANPQMKPQMQAPMQPQMQQGQPVNSLTSAAQPTLAEQVSQPSQGGGAFNGVIYVQGNPVQVKNGIAEYQDDRVFVSSDGSFVMDEQRNVLGKIVNNEFMPTDEAHIMELRQKGIVE